MLLNIIKTSKIREILLYSEEIQLKDQINFQDLRSTMVAINVQVKLKLEMVIIGMNLLEKVFYNWAMIDRLPKWTVVGLKHSVNQKDKFFIWNGIKYDPADPKIPPPPGFKRVFGGDIGTKAGESYYWYEKERCPELVLIHLTERLNKSLVLSISDPKEMDRDGDKLVDYLEGELENIFRPYLILDSYEKIRREYEPFVPFQIHPLDLKRSPQKIGIKWVFLFRRDGGY